MRSEHLDGVVWLLLEASSEQEREVREYMSYNMGVNDRLCDDMIEGVREGWQE